jgi:hypothetical protein
LRIIKIIIYNKIITAHKIHYSSLLCLKQICGAFSYTYEHSIHRILALKYAYAVLSLLPSRWRWGLPAFVLLFYHKTRCMRYFNLTAVNGLVSMSAKFSLLRTLPLYITFTAITSRTQWYAIALWFFFRVETGIVALITTDWLSQKTLWLHHLLVFQASAIYSVRLQFVPLQFSLW